MEKINKVAPNINTKEAVKINYSYKQFQYLINNINAQKNFIVKLIYLDLYLNVVAPKCEILNEFRQLNQKITETNSELIATKNELSKTNSVLILTTNELSKTKEELIKTKNDFSLQNSNLQHQIDFLAAELLKINPKFDITQFISKK